MIYIARLITINSSVDHSAIARNEQERVAVILTFKVVAPVSFIVRHALAKILDHP
jgi:hypothetical protein